MDLVGNSTAVIDKLKFTGKPNDRLGEMMDYLRRTLQVRDVVVSGGDVANMPRARLEDFLTKLLHREHPRRPARHQGADRAPAALAAGRRAQRHGAGRHAGPPAGRSVAIHTHTNHANSVIPIVAEATRAMLDTGIRDVRNQGVLLNGVNADPVALLDLCFALLDGAQISAYYFYMCDMILHFRALAVSVAARSGCSTTSWATSGVRRPRGSCDVPFVGSAGCTSSPTTTPSAASPTGRRTTAPRSRRPPPTRCRAPTSTTTRSTRCRSPPAVVGRARQPRRERAQGRRGGRALLKAAAGGAPGVLDASAGQPTERFSYGVLSTMVVRVDTLAAASMRASRSSRVGRRGDPHLQDVRLVAGDRPAGLDLGQSAQAVGRVVRLGRVDRPDRHERRQGAGRAVHSPA